MPYSLSNVNKDLNMHFIDFSKPPLLPLQIKEICANSLMQKYLYFFPLWVCVCFYVPGIVLDEFVDDFNVCHVNAQIYMYICRYYVVAAKHVPSRWLWVMVREYALVKVFIIHWCFWIRKEETFGKNIIEDIFLNREILL